MDLAAALMALGAASTALDTQRDNLAANLTTMGVPAVNTETLAQLVPKVLDVHSKPSSEYGLITFTAAVPTAANIMVS